MQLLCSTCIILSLFGLMCNVQSFLVYYRQSKSLNQFKLKICQGVISDKITTFLQVNSVAGNILGNPCSLDKLELFCMQVDTYRLSNGAFNTMAQSYPTVSVSSCTWVEQNLNTAQQFAIIRKSVCGYWVLYCIVHRAGLGLDYSTWNYRISNWWSVYSYIDFMVIICKFICMVKHST